MKYNSYNVVMLRNNYPLSEIHTKIFINDIKYLSSSTMIRGWMQI